MCLILNTYCLNDNKVTISMWYVLYVSEFSKKPEREQCQWRGPFSAVDRELLVPFPSFSLIFLLRVPIPPSLVIQYSTTYCTTIGPFTLYK